MLTCRDKQAGRQAVEQGEERQLFVNGFLLDRVSIFNDLDLALIVLRALIVALCVYVARCTYVYRAKRNTSPICSGLYLLLIDVSLQYFIAA